MVATDQKTPVLKADTVEQLSVLETLKAFGKIAARFSLGLLTVAAGVRASTVRTLFEQWKEQGLPLLNEVKDGGEATDPLHGRYMLNPEMQATVEAAITATDPALVLSLRRAEARREARRRDENRTPREPITRMNLLDAANQMLARANQAADSENRTALLTEADRLIKRCFVILCERAEAGRSGPSPALQDELERIRDGIAQRLQTGAPIAPTL